jgi:hypothetical protein
MPEGVSYSGVFGELKEEEVRTQSSGFARSPMTKSVGNGASLERLRSLGSLPGAPVSPAEPVDLPDRTRKDSRQEEDAARRIAGLEIRLEAPATLRVGQELGLTVTFTNRGRSAVEVPDRLDLRTALLRILDGAWKETRIGGTRKPDAMSSLAPGASVTRKLTIPADRCQALTRAGVLHLVLEGTGPDALDSNRVTVRVLP